MFDDAIDGASGVIPLDQSPLALSGPPQVFDVTTTNDVVNTADGVLSLREAILAAHQVDLAVDVVINLPHGVYDITRETLQLTQVGGDIRVLNTEADPVTDPSSGDFDIHRSLTINGHGARITGDGQGRVFQIGGDITVTLTDLTVADGGGAIITQGGGLYVSGGVDLMLNDVDVDGNQFSGRGGGLYADNDGGAITLHGGRFFNNAARASAGGIAFGGGIYLDGGRLEIDATTFAFNAARGGDAGEGFGGSAAGGAIYVADGVVSMAGARFEANDVTAGRGGQGAVGGEGDGGAIYVQNSSSFVIEDSEFLQNRAWGGDGGQGGHEGGDGGSAWGGAIHLGRGSVALTIERSRFADNQAMAGAGGDGDRSGGDGGRAWGGAIASINASLFSDGRHELTVRDTLFEDNLARGGAGGRVEQSNEAQLAAMVFGAGTGVGGHGGEAAGGALYALATNGGYPISRSTGLALTDSPFLDNHAMAGAGGWVSTGEAGQGGDARGGAVATSGSVIATIGGSLSQESLTGDPDTLTALGTMTGNQAVAGSGGEKIAGSLPSVNDAAGRGGDASGGAVAADGTSLTVAQILFLDNGAFAGNGGTGAKFTTSVVTDTDILTGNQVQRTVYTPAVGTVGGDNGTARGGAVYAAADVTSTDSAFSRNVAAGARIALSEDASDVGTAALLAGAGGFDRNGVGLRGGAGGSAFGGGLFVRDHDLTVTGSSFNGNQALASGGGAGYAGAGDRVGGDGGAGGKAGGGAIRVETDGTLAVATSVFLANYIQGGRGGSGGRGGDAADGSFVGMVGGRGGDGGYARGGAISVGEPGSLRTPTVELNQTYVRENLVVAGDGGFAGNGGGGLHWGGSGGTGGNGGWALGGGVDIVNGDTTMTRSTVEHNKLSAGFGAAGGYGGGSTWGGGAGGDGGNGGRAGGGGIATLDGSLSVDTSTIVLNEVLAGFGGNGGFGGAAKAPPEYLTFGGSGGDGGIGGSAYGGGIYADSLTPTQISVSTIARNVLDAAGGGFAGALGTQTDEAGTIDPTTPFRYDVATGQKVFDGAAHVLYPEFYAAATTPTGGFTGVFSTRDGVLYTADVGQSLGADSFSANTLQIADDAGLAAAGVTLGGSIGVGVGVGVGVVVAHNATVAALNATLGASAVVPAGVGTVFAVTGAFAVAGLVLASGAVVLGRAIALGIETGDWEGAFQDALGVPGAAYPRTLITLLTGSPDLDEDGNADLPIPANHPGAAGRDGTAEGNGIWADTVAVRSLISDNTAVERSRSRDIGSGSHLGAYVVSETVADVSVADVGGFLRVDDRNFIGAMSGLAAPNDTHGTLDQPLSAKPDTETRFNGGLLPTLKLLPGSPARGAIFTGELVSLSQNDFFWIGPEPADIGAWGGPPNRAPTGGADDFTVAEDGVITITASQLLGNDTDPDGDTLSFVDYRATDPVTGENQLQGTLTPLYAQIAGTDQTVLVHLEYRPAPDFSGEATFFYRVTDGEFERFVPVTIDVTPVNDAPLASGGAVVTAEDTVVDVDLRTLVSDKDTPLAQLAFGVGAAVNGSVVLLDDGHTACFTPGADFNGGASFAYTVVDHGDGYGPTETVGPRTIAVSVTSVNDAPANVLPGAQSVDEDGKLAITGLGVADVDAGAGNLEVTLGVQHGTLSLTQTAGLVFRQGDGTDDATMTVAGNLAAINAALASLSYSPLLNFNGLDQLQIATDDLGNTGSGGPLTDTDAVAILVNAVNDAPVIAVPGAQTGYEDVRLSFNDIAIADVDAAEGSGIVRVTLSVDHGTLTLAGTAGLTFTAGNGVRNAAMSFTGILADVNAALLGAYYLGALNYSGSDQLRIDTDDLGNTGSGGSGGALTDSQTIAISVLSSAQQANLLTDGVTALHDAGFLSGGEIQSLLTKLSLKGNAGDAGKVQGFINQVGDFIDSGKLTEAVGQALIKSAEILLASVSNSSR